MILTIFPEGGLASSVITTVWVGVCVTCFFNLRFGWVLSGLVVPGYLVPLLIVKPVSALVIVIEAVLAYSLVWLFSEKLGQGRWPSLFGRDRFMGLILSSIAVRLSFDGYLLPIAAQWIEANWNQQVHWQSDLQSFGLVIISLLANQFWKPGLRRGLFSTVVIVGLTWLIVRYGLMDFTNFRMSGVTYLYEGLASSIMASPKAYIILVITALYASHMNVRYGWDFSGILIPALIALQWYQPTKIVTSFAEAALIYFIARQLLKTPMLASATIEGANKILLFFNISFVLKLLVGWALLWLGWEVKTSDFYGFGYLLSTLLAMKAHDKDIFPRLMRSTLQVSFVGAGLGNLIGFVLAVIVPATGIGAARQSITQGGWARENALLVEAAGDARWRMATGEREALSAASADALGDTIELLEAGLPPVQAGATAMASGWRVEALGEQRIALARADGAGRDLLVFNGAAKVPLAIAVSETGAVPGLVGSAQAIMRRLDARWLLVTTPRDPTQAGRSVLDVLRARLAAPLLEVDVALTDAPPALALSGSSAQVIDIARLRGLWPSLDVGFALEGDGAAARLVLPTASIGTLLANNTASATVENQCELPRASGVPRVRTLEQRIFLHDEVVQPLLNAIEARQEPTIAIAAARLTGLSLTPCSMGDRHFYMLTSEGGGDGTFLFDRAGDRGIVVESALRRERRGSATARPRLDPAMASAGLRLQAASRAGLLAFAPREIQYDGKQSTAFGIITQAAIGQLGNDEGLVIQLRPRPRYAARDVAPDAMVITLDRLEGDPAETERYAALIRNAGYRPVVATRERAFAGFEAYRLGALHFLDQSYGKRYVIAHLPARGQ